MFFLRAPPRLFISLLLISLLLISLPPPCEAGTKTFTTGTLTGFTYTILSDTPSSLRLFASNLPNTLSPYAQLKLQTFINHTSSYEIILSLKSPSQVRVLVAQSNRTLDIPTLPLLPDMFYGTIFYDGAAKSVAAATSSPEPELRPLSSFSGFAGGNPNGVWELIYSDSLPLSDQGNIERVDLTITDGCINNTCVRGTCVASGPNSFTCDCTGTGATGARCETRNFTTFPVTTGILTGNQYIIRYTNIYANATLRVFGHTAPLSSQAVITMRTYIIHSFTGDILMTLAGPSGTQIKITAQSFSGTAMSNGYYNILWADNATITPHTQTVSNYPSPLKPDQPLSTFAGKDPNGLWTLYVNDDYPPEDFGSIESWELIIEDGCLAHNCTHGTCVPTSKSTYVCSCFAGYMGTYCETDADECAGALTGNNCGANSVCINTSPGFLCACQNGYSGDGITCTDVNECSGFNYCGVYFPQSSQCTNTLGGYNCSCVAGYFGEGMFCFDLDECWYGNHNCSANANCVNTMGSYSCGCKTGFVGDGYNCADVNECSLGTHNCSAAAICVNTAGSFNCTCKPGYSGTNGNCADIDECSLVGTHNCSTNALCANTPGSFTCACKSGFSGNGVTCSDVNECTLGTSNCSPNGICTNTIGSFTCACKSGFSGDGVTCSDINECLTAQHNCSVLAVCGNTLGGFTCTCGTGYSGTGVTCSDINECSSNPCNSNANCLNTVGSFGCQCKPGYSGDGFTCADVNECSLGTHSCSSNANCSNTIGSYGCTCKTGFSGNGLFCSDVNECISGANNCNAQATCNNTLGSFSCSCNAGFSGNGVSCTDIDECAQIPSVCPELSNCQNVAGGYLCPCKDGATGASCDDVNECLLGTHNCSSNGVCTNTPTSFTCSCKPGFLGDGYTCNDINECLSASTCHTDALCTNTQGAFLCTCKPGFFGDGLSCTDFDECQGQNGGNDCDQHATCTNSPGSHSCSCDPGFLGNGSTCQDENECVSFGGNCTDNSNCVNTEGSFYCACSSGFSKVGQDCLDINECLGANSCDPNAECSNTVGSYSCSCKTGFVGNGTSCSDVNECDASGICHSDANCLNTPGSFLCSCKSGFYGTGLVCTDFNECSGENGGHNCSANGICTNSNGGFSCACSPGFLGNGYSCTDINECQGSNNCDSNALCTNTQGSFYCTCSAGFFGIDGTSCTDINECLDQGGNSCHVFGQCQNQVGSFTCSCKPGFTGNGTFCADLNECNGEGTGNTCHSNATCTNFAGGFSCTCKNGFFGSGSLCVEKASFVVLPVSSTTVVISWKAIPQAIGYEVGLGQNQQFEWKGQVPASQTSITINTLTPLGAYEIQLKTYATITPSFGINSVQFQSWPAPVSNIRVSKKTFSSVILTWDDQDHGLFYRASVVDLNNQVIKEEALITQNVQTTRKRALVTKTATISNLPSAKGMKIKIFVGSETIGSMVTTKTSPLAPQNLIAYRHDSLSLSFEWTHAVGATQYELIMYSLNNTLLQTKTFPFLNSTVVYVPAAGVEYIFTLFSGDEDGFDYSQGSSVTLSTTTVFCEAMSDEVSNWGRVKGGEKAYGQCKPGFGGKPYRTCNDTTGLYGPITNFCIPLPNPLSHPLSVIPYSSSALLSWVPENNTDRYQANLIYQGDNYIVNNGVPLTGSSILILFLRPLRNYTVVMYAGNRAGFETRGSWIDFTTHIANPEVTVDVGMTYFALNWTSPELAEWFSLTIIDLQNGTTLKSERVTVTSMNITGQLPASKFLVTIHSGKGLSYMEPYGTNLTVVLLSVPESGTQIDWVTIILSSVFGVLGCVVAILAILYIQKRRKINKRRGMIENEMMESTTKERASSLSLGRDSFAVFDYETGRRSSSGRRPSREADSTLLNTSLEISVPAFLELNPETQFRRYEAFGAGGVGTVFKGELIDPDLVKQHGLTQIAIKRVEVMLKGTKEETIDVFLQEVSIIWSCTFHPNVMKLVGYSKFPEMLLVTKLYPLDLDTFIKNKNEEFPPLLVMKIASDIASAMAFCQSLGIIHRDLKSANVLLEEVPFHGGTILRGVICDFGLAKITSAAYVVGDQKFIDIAGFSPRFAAPEIFQYCAAGSSPPPQIEPLGDVYSFAIVLWEMLHRQNAWNLFTKDEIELRVRSGQRPPVTENYDEVYLILVQIMKACWAQEASQRPPFKQILEGFASKISV